MTRHIVIRHISIVLRHQHRAIRPDQNRGERMHPGVPRFRGFGNRQPQQRHMIQCFTRHRPLLFLPISDDRVAASPPASKPRFASILRHKSAAASGFAYKYSDTPQALAASMRHELYITLIFINFQTFTRSNKSTPSPDVALATAKPSGLPSRNRSAQKPGVCRRLKTPPPARFQQKPRPLPTETLKVFQPHSA